MNISLNTRQESIFIMGVSPATNHFHQSSASTRKSCSGHSSYFKLIFRVRNDIFFNLLTNKNRNFDTMRILIAVRFYVLETAFIQ